MRTFVLPDLHGYGVELTNLLNYAGVCENGERLDGDFQVVSVGDLVNATGDSMARDEAIVGTAESLIDVWVLGNHEAAYFSPHMGFDGFTPHAPVRTEFNRGMRSGKIVPCALVGETLITHAGLVEWFRFKTAQEAHDAIWDVYMNFFDYANPVGPGRATYSGQPYQWGNTRLPKGTLLDAIPEARGGRHPYGGVLWADWSERKNRNFSQVFGHTPMTEGPALEQFLRGEVFHVNIDAGAKKGKSPVGVWLDGDGQIIDFVEGANGSGFREEKAANA
jgi:hypothetical protein